MTEKLIAGIDIGGTNSVLGLVNPLGKIVFRRSILTCNFPSPVDFAREMCALIRKAEIECGAEVRAIGIGAPSGNFYHGTLENPPNMPWKGIIPLASLFIQECGLRTVLTNDANAAAMGEMRYGIARTMREVLYITLGTGVGSAIITNGKIMYGHLGFAGELGHVTIEKNGRLCGCGKKGCLEAYCSAPGMVITYHQQGGDKSVISAKAIYERAVQNDKAALATFTKTAQWLGFTLANCVAVTGPEAVILFGGPTAAGDILLTALREAMEENLMFLYKGKVKLLVSSLPANDAAILGAASLVKK